MNNPVLFHHLQLFLTLAQLLPQDGMFSPKHDGVVSLLFIEYVLDMAQFFALLHEYTDPKCAEWTTTKFCCMFGLP